MAEPASEGGLERPVTHPERRKRPPVRLSAGTRAAFGAVSEVVAPESERFAFDVKEQGCAFLAGYLAHLPWALRKAFPIGLMAFEWAAVLFGGGGRFSRLDRAARLRYVHRVETWRLLSPLAEVWIAVRGLAAAGFYTQAEVLARIGFAHQPWIDAKVKERRERFGAPEPW